VAASGALWSEAALELRQLPFRVQSGAVQVSDCRSFEFSLGLGSVAWVTCVSFALGALRIDLGAREFGRINPCAQHLLACPLISVRAIWISRGSDATWSSL